MEIKITKSSTSRIAEVDFSNLPFGRNFADHMFVCDYFDGKWQNPRIEPFHNFSLHPATMALHYGQAIFEGMKASKTHDGTPMLFRPERHAHRMNISAQRLCMPEFPEDLFVEGLTKLVSLDLAWIPEEEGSALYIRPTMIATDEFFGVKPSQSYKFFIFTGPVGPYYPKPVRLWAETTYIRAAQGGTGFAKAAGNYAGALYPAKLAQDRGFDQLLWLDAKEFKYIQESGTMNVFFVIDGVTITPPLSGTILDGVTRDCILEILRSEGKPVSEHPITIDEVVAAYHNGTLQEAFGAGTAAVVSHVAEIGYKDLLMTLPPVSERKIGTHVKTVIDGLRAGTIADKWGWTAPIHAEELVA